MRTYGASEGIDPDDRMYLLDVWRARDLSRESCGHGPLLEADGMGLRDKCKSPAESARVEVVPNPLIVNRDDIVQRTQCIVCHGGSFSCWPGCV